MQKKEYVLDAAGKTLGRLAVQAAVFLRGKNQIDFLHRLTSQNQVVIFNTDNIKVTGKKLKQKLYRRHSGYPGGLKQESLEELMEKDSRQALWRAIYGMLPKNRTRDKIMKNLKLYKKEI